MKLPETMTFSAVQKALVVFFFVTYSLTFVALFSPFWVTLDISKIEDDGLEYEYVELPDLPLFSLGQLIGCMDPYDEAGVRTCRLMILFLSIGDGGSAALLDLGFELGMSQFLSIASSVAFLSGGIVSAVALGKVIKSKKELTGVAFAMGCLGGKFDAFCDKYLHVRIVITLSIIYMIH